MSSVTVTIDRGSVDAMYANPAGPVQEYLGSLAQSAYDIARENCPRATAVRRQPRTEVPLVDSHRVLREGVLWFVVAEATYAIYVHQGTRPHPISPRPESIHKMLVFEGNAGTVFLKIPPHAPVNHPGTTGQPWLYQAMVAVVPR